MGEIQTKHERNMLLFSRPWVVITDMYDPVSNGNCQFSAILDQLSKLGIMVSEKKLRKSVVDYIKLNRYNYEQYVEGPLCLYNVPRRNIPWEQPYNEKLHEELNILHLPTEILRIIIKKCSTNVISRQCINMTCSKFLDIMTSLPQNYRLYIKPCSEMALGLKNVMSYRLSIQELIRTVGRGSGIIMSVQGMIAHPLWDRAWLKIQRENSHGWFRVKRVYWWKKTLIKKRFLKK